MPVLQEAKLKAKKSAVWQDRLAKQGEQQQAKQQKRQGNIDSRIQAKKDKKKQKVGAPSTLNSAGSQGMSRPGQAGVLHGGTSAVCVCLSVRLHALCPNPPRPPPAACSCLCVQRENKLLRAGFEGRKQGFIETPKRAAAPAAAAK